MKTLKYSIKINKPCDLVFNKIMDRSVYAYWAKAWGEGMAYEGEWKQGGHISFFDKTKGRTKVYIEELNRNDSIKSKHVAMVNPKNVEIEPTEEMMKKWIGSREEYYFIKDGKARTTLEVVLEVDPVFQEMFDKAWPKALEYFKEVCER
jgi:hypothetical protein